MQLMTRWNNCEIHLHQGDITTLQVDAIVNAANEQLRPGGGVCGAIHRAGGPAIAEACALAISQRGGPLRPGEAAITTGGNLPAKHIIHAVGPFYEDNRQAAPAILANAYRNSLRLARENGLHSIAFPCISTGIYGYPPDEACSIAVASVREELERHGGLENVIFCVFLASDHALYGEQIIGG